MKKFHSTFIFYLFIKNYYLLIILPITDYLVLIYMLHFHDFTYQSLMLLLSLCLSHMFIIDSNDNDFYHNDGNIILRINLNNNNTNNIVIIIILIIYLKNVCTIHRPIFLSINKILLQVLQMKWNKLL